jgi:hypothetical protein
MRVVLYFRCSTYTVTPREKPLKISYPESGEEYLADADTDFQTAD